MPTFYRAAALVAILAIAAGGAVLLIGRMGQPNVAAPLPPATASPTPTPFLPGSAAASATPRISPSPLEGRAVLFPVPFSYTLPAGEDLVVSPDQGWYQFRHQGPDGSEPFWDRGVIVRAVTGGRADPCAETSAARPLADAQAFFDYFATVPTMQVSGVAPTTIDGHEGLGATVEFTAATADCPDVWLWTEEGSITQNGGRDPKLLRIVDIEGMHVMTLSSGPDSFLPKADELISSIRFDRPSSSASPAP